MEINKFDFADAELKNIYISNDNIKISISLDDDKKTNLEIDCRNAIGMDNLCMWDDTYIDNLSVVLINDPDEYLKKVFKSYDVNADYGKRSLRNPIFDIQITLINNITCHIYCQNYFIHKKQGFHF